MSMWLPAPICAQATMDTLGALTINGVLMHKDGAWNVLNPQVLWVATDTRGGNSIVSHAEGRRKKPWHLDQSTYSLRLVVDGVYDENGNPHPNVWEGVEYNTEYLYQNIVIPPTEPTASWDASLEMPSGDVREGEVQPRPFAVNDPEAGVYTTILPLIVPGVRLQPASS